MFERRKKGQCFNQPYLGCRGFSASFRLVDSQIEPDLTPIAETRELGWMLYDLDYSHPADPQQNFSGQRWRAGGSILIKRSGGTRMILQALKEYYDRKTADLENGIAPRGWLRRIDFVIVVTLDGTFKQLDCEQTIKNNKTVSHSCLLPYISKQALKHTMSGKDANLLWDNATFVLGVGKNGDKKLASFIAAIKERLGDINDQGSQFRLKFLEDGQRILPYLHL